MSKVMHAQVRQGDVLLIPCEPPTEPVSLVQPDGDVYVLAHGETTGFRHFMRASEVRMCRYKDNETLIEVLEDGALLEHAGQSSRKHASVAFRAGWYRFIHQRQLEADQIRDVRD